MRRSIFTPNARLCHGFAKVIRDPSMSYRSPGRTALQVGPLAVGTVNFGWLTSQSASFDIINTALDRGLNLIDTSDNYKAGKICRSAVRGHWPDRHRSRTWGPKA
jgi:aryl-alcohol dehydrogenase-like predicted oxidoreductase